MALISTERHLLKKLPERPRPIRRVDQIKSRVCWAACVEMVATSLGKKMSQCEIIQKCLDAKISQHPNVNVACSSGELAKSLNTVLEAQDMSKLWGAALGLTPTFHRASKTSLKLLEDDLLKKKAPIQILAAGHYALAISLKRKRIKGKIRKGLCLADPREDLRGNRFIWVNFIKNDSRDGKIFAIWTGLSEEKQ